MKNQAGTLSLFKYPETTHMPLLQPIAEGGADNPEPVLHAAAEVDGRGFWKILCGTGDFGHLEAGIENLRQHLVVKDEIIRIGVVVDGLQNLP